MTPGLSEFFSLCLKYLQPSIPQTGILPEEIVVLLHVNLSVACGARYESPWLT